MIFSQVRSKWSGQDISNVITSGNSKALVGLPESVVGKINQRIRDVRTEGGSAAVVGVYSGKFSLRDIKCRGSSISRLIDDIELHLKRMPVTSSTAGMCSQN